MHREMLIQHLVRNFYRVLDKSDTELAQRELNHVRGMFGRLAETVVRMHRIDRWYESWNKWMNGTMSLRGQGDEQLGSDELSVMMWLERPRGSVNAILDSGDDEMGGRVALHKDEGGDVDVLNVHDGTALGKYLVSSFFEKLFQRGVLADKMICRYLFSMIRVAMDRVQHMPE
jgi:hypothetical protein